MVELGSLVGPERILDRELVEAELVGQLVQLLVGRPAEIDPDDGVGPREVVGHVGDGEVLRLEHSLAVDAGVGHGASSACGPSEHAMLRHGRCAQSA